MLSSSFLVVLCVAVVVVVLVLPSWVARNSATGGPDQPVPPAPTQGPYEIGTRTWTATSCPGRGLGCRVPLSLDLGGARFVHVHSHRQGVSQRDPGTRTLVRRVSPASGRRWLLVGADGTSSASELSLTIAQQLTSPISSGTLTLVAVPGTHRPVRVVVSDYGTVGVHEVLRIEEYDAQD